MTEIKPGIVLVIQRVDRAKLLLDNVNQWEEMKKGYVVYFAVLKGATQINVEAAVRLILRVRNIEDNGERVSLLESLERKNLSEFHWDLMLVPQATLGARIKNNALQFHSLIAKSEGERLYKLFQLLLQEQISKECKDNKTHPIKIVAGTYGNRQECEIFSSGPHTLQFQVSYRPY